MKPFLHIISIVAILFLTACGEDDSLSINADMCNESPSSENCRTFFESDWSSEDEFQEYLQGNWQQIAKGNSWVAPFCENLDSDQRIRFSYSADGVFSYTLPSGERASTDYDIDLQCGIAPPCRYVIDYEEVLGFRPDFQNMCAVYAFYDFRASDGEYEVYVKDN
ncbi:MAG: hypothetical protein AAF741_01970 [Bacteroidota bacterium]